MSVVRVAIPVLHGRRRFHFDKGRPWSILEHLILAALASKEATALDLAREGDIPQRIVIEALIRLMRAGWVEMVQQPKFVLFSPTQEGLVAATLPELPNAPRRLSRNMNFVVDQITGAIYRSRQMPFLHQHMVEDRAARERIVWLERPSKPKLEEVRPLVEALFQDDEKFIAMDPAGDRLAERWALITVRDGEPEGLTNHAPAVLRDAVIRAASLAPERKDQPGKLVVAAPIPTSAASVSMPPEHQISFSTNDLILGGPEHEEALRSALRRARHRVIIHSTFIGEEQFDALLGDLKVALSKGAKVDVLWGQDDTVEGVRSTRVVVGRLRSKLEASGLERLTIHPFSTASHSKLLVVDEGSVDRLTAYLGSCNWLSTGFSSYEASVPLRDSGIVADVLDQLAELSRGSNGHWTELTNDFVALASNLRALWRQSSGRARASIVLGVRHAELVRKARDNSLSRIFVASHRLGVASGPAVLSSVLAAARSKPLRVDLFYGTPSGPFSGSDAAQLIRSASLNGVNVRPVHRPRLHAKLLAWDDDAAVVTSQNWLSADPPDDRPRQEIGVYVNAPGVARTLIDRFQAARLD